MIFSLSPVAIAISINSVPGAHYAYVYIRHQPNDTMDSMCGMVFVECIELQHIQIQITLAETVSQHMKCSNGCSTSVNDSTIITA